MAASIDFPNPVPFQLAHDPSANEWRTISSFGSDAGVGVRLRM